MTHGAMGAGDDNEVAVLLAGDDSPTAAAPPLESAPVEGRRFFFNQRRCIGNDLHEAVLSGNIVWVNQLLEGRAVSVHDRFSYECTYHGKSQRGSGMAIHLAAAKGHQGVMSALLDARASLYSKVTRGDEDHYDVLHAAVFSEGRGGDPGPVAFLLKQRAPLQRNANGHTPLHVAFLTGSRDLVWLLRRYAESECVGDIFGEDIGDEMRVMRQNGSSIIGHLCEGASLGTPLELGITNGKMSAEVLSELAPLTPSALNIFVHHATDCIEPFLQRCLERHIRASQLARHVNFRNVAAVLRENPAAGASLVEALSARPSEDNAAWHPLPTRLSFEPRDVFERIHFSPILNPPPCCLTFYERDLKWEYDNTSFSAPDWHHKLTDRTAAGTGQPGSTRLARDVGIRVCHVPNIASAEVLAALGACKLDDEEGNQIFSRPVFKGLIAHVWMTGALRADIIQGCLSLYCLVVVIIEQTVCLNRDPPAHARSLMAHGGSSLPDELDVFGGLGSDWILPGAKAVPVSMNLIAARGVVLLSLDLLGLLRYARVRRTNLLVATYEYMRFGTAYGLFQSFFQCWMFVDCHNVHLRVFAIFLCWTSLLQALTPSECIARELVPLMLCAKGLLPSIILALVFFAAFFHVIFNLKGVRSLATVDDLLLETFSMLFTSSLPAEAGDPCIMAFVILAVCVFSIFFLNIFIGVISEQYSHWKSMGDKTYQQVLCHRSLVFCLRAHYLPTRLCSGHAAWVFLALGWLGIIAIQVVDLAMDIFLPGSRLGYVAGCLVVVLASFQGDATAWFQDAKADLEKSNRYLWIAVPSQKKNESAQGFDDLACDVRQVLEILQRLQRSAGSEAAPQSTMGFLHSARTRDSLGVLSNAHTEKDLAARWG